MTMEAYPTVPIAPIGFTANDMFFPEGVITFGNVTPSTSANVVAWPMFADRATVIDLVKIWLVTAQAGAECMAGIYSNANGRPSGLISDLGTKSLASGGGAAVNWSGISVPVSGWFWVVIWVKNVATQATVFGPTTYIGTGPVAQGATFLDFQTTRNFLYLVSAYPGSMPATAPSVATTFVATVPLPMVRFT